MAWKWNMARHSFIFFIRPKSTSIFEVFVTLKQMEDLLRCICQFPHLVNVLERLSLNISFVKIANCSYVTHIKASMTLQNTNPKKKSQCKTLIRKLSVIKVCIIWGESKFGLNYLKDL